MAKLNNLTTHYKKVRKKRPGVHSKNKNTNQKNGKYYAEKQQYHLSRTGGFANNDPKDTYRLYLSSTNNLDATVDIVAPGNDIFQYYKFQKNFHQLLYLLPIYQKLQLMPQRKN